MLNCVVCGLFCKNNLAQEVQAAKFYAHQHSCEGGNYVVVQLLTTDGIYACLQKGLALKSAAVIEMLQVLFLNSFTGKSSK